MRVRISSHIQANKARKSFMKYVFHEIRNPLNSLTLGLNVINSSSKLTTSEKESLDTMEESVLFMSNTLNDILSMHSIEDGEFQLISKEFNLKEALFNSILPLKLIADDKNIEVSVDLTYMVPQTVIGDRIRIDEGPGIPENVLISFLQPFVQLRNDEVSLGVTNGLGLALARDIIELHGGNLFITKRSNQSMRLGFSIPFDVLSKDVSAGELVKCIHSKRYISNPDIVNYKYQHNKSVATSVNSSIGNSPMGYNLHFNYNNLKPLPDNDAESYKYQESYHNKEDGDVINVLETNKDKRKCILIVD
eukprot:gene22129-28654_t